ncbi:hypothetical protein [Campylobacter sp. RM16188]|nr:hypothetical protein [Campylobacter sp. RM16188]
MRQDEELRGKSLNKNNSSNPIIPYDYFTYAVTSIVTSNTRASFIKP